MRRPKEAMINEQPSTSCSENDQHIFSCKQSNFLPGSKVLDYDNNCIIIAELEAPQEL